MENINSISFGTNWNSKLSCSAFSTIRIRNDKKYIIGHEYTIILKEQPIYVARLVCISHFMLDGLSEGMAYIDTGYNKKETIAIIEKMYKNKDIDVHAVTWSHLVFFHDTKL